MLWLIDGYNLMHAAGAVGSKETTAHAFRRRRRVFLTRLAHALGSERARETTIVFDANSPPTDFDLETTYNELRLIFALGDENADARIEQLIAAHSAPKSLTVVSTDRRIRRAATRRKAKAMTADEFLDELDRLREPKSRERLPQKPPNLHSLDRDAPVPPQEAAFWLEEFAALDASQEIQQAIAPDQTLVTDDEIAQIQREVDRET
jgi:predicted RNA-binding protein with PIN domain